MANDEVVNFDTMRDMVLNTTEKGPIDPKTNKAFDPTRQIQSKGRFQFKWNTKTKDIVTTHISRSTRSTINEKRTIDGLDTLSNSSMLAHTFAAAAQQLPYYMQTSVNHFDNRNKSKLHHEATNLG